MIPFIESPTIEHVCGMKTCKYWDTADLFEQIKDSSNIVEYELDTYSVNLNVRVWQKEMSIFDFLNHVKRINKANLDFPLIISAEGWILDGWHRLLKAIINDIRYIKAIRFKINPPHRTTKNKNHTDK